MASKTEIKLALRLEDQIEREIVGEQLKKISDPSPDAVRVIRGRIMEESQNNPQGKKRRKKNNG